MAVPQFSEITKDPEWGQMSREEKEQITERYYLNVIQKDPDFGQMGANEQEQIHTRLYSTAGIADNEPQLDMDDPALAPRPVLEGRVEKRVTFPEGLGNVANAIGEGIGDAGRAIIDPDTYKNMLGGIGGGFQQEFDTIKDQAQPASFPEELRQGASSYMATQGGLINAARDLYQLPISIWSDIGNAYEGRDVYKPAIELLKAEELPFVGGLYKKAMEEHPVFKFGGEQVPYLIPGTRAAKSIEMGNAGRLGGLVRSAGEAGYAGAAMAPDEQGLKGRIAGAAAAGGLTVGAGAAGGALVKGLKKEMLSPRLEVRGEIARPTIDTSDLRVQDLEMLHPLDTAVPNNINPITGRPYTQELLPRAQESAQALKQNFADIKTSEQIYKASLQDYETKVGNAMRMSGTGDIAEAQRVLGQRINELEPKANTGMMSEIEAVELMEARTALDDMLQAGKNLSDASDLLQETKTPMQRGGLTINDAPEGPAMGLQNKNASIPGLVRSPQNGAKRVDMLDSQTAIPNRVEGEPVLQVPPPARRIDMLDPVTPSSELDYLFQNSNRPINEGLQLGRMAAEPSTLKSKERGFISTVKEANTTAPELKNQVDGDYVPVTNKETLERAQAIVEENPEAAYKQVMREEQPTAETYAMAQDLMRRYQNAGDFESAADLAEVIAQRATEQGQAIQALSMWGRLSPEGALVTAERIAKKAGLGESKEAVVKLSDAVERFRKTGDKKTAAQIKDFANKSSRASFKKALAKLSQEELDNLGKVLGC